MIRHSLPTLGEEEADAAARVIRSGMVAQGREVQAFEEETAAFVGRRYGVAVSSGTAALHLSLRALGCGPESVVGLPAYACASLVTAVGMNNSVSRLLDIDERFAMNIKQIPQDADTLIVPHLFGGVAELSDAENVIEDIAQSIGNGTGAGSKVAVASFYATKLLTTGEGGMVLTDDSAIAEFARDHRDYDNRDDYRQRYPYKMTDVQAAMGRVQLTKLPGFLERRRVVAERYREGLAGLPVVLPEHWDQHAYFRFVVLTDQRERLETFLNARGIEAKRPVYSPAHRYFERTCPANVRVAGDYPRADRAHAEALSLPIHPQMSDAEVGTVVKAVEQFFEESQ